MRKPSCPKRLALDLLCRSPLKVQMSAVLHKDGHIFAWGWNSGWMHAEKHAVSRANPHRLAGATCVVAGRNRSSGRFVYSKPCARVGRKCLELLKARGIKRVEFLTPNGAWEVIDLGE